MRHIELKRRVISACVVAAVSGLAASVNAADLTWSGGATGNWDTTTPNWTGATWNSATPDSAIFGSAATIQLPTTADTIVVDNITTNAAVTLGAVISSGPAASPDQRLTLNGGADGVVTFSGTATLIIENYIRVSGSPSGGIVKTGTGRVFFKDQENDFVGNFVINASGTDTNGGSFQLGGVFNLPVTEPPTPNPYIIDGGLGAASNNFTLNTNFTLFTNAGQNIVLNPLRTFTINGASTLTVSGQANQTRAVTILGAISGTGAKLALIGASTRLTIGGANSFTGDVTVAGGGVNGSAATAISPTILTVGTGAADTTATLGNGLNNVVVNSATPNVSGTPTYSPGVIEFSRSSYTFGGNISGSGEVRVTNAGTITLTGTNTYTGTTQINTGVLSVASNVSLPDASNLRFQGSAILELAGDFDAGSSADFSRALGTGANQVRFPGGGGFAAKGADRVINIGGAGATLQWGTTANFLGNGSALILGSATATHTAILKNPIDMTNGATFIREWRALDGAAAVDGRIDGVVSGDALQTLRKTNTGTLQLAAANTFSGPVLIDTNGGTLLISDGDGLGATSGVTVRAGSTLKLSNALAKAPVVTTPAAATVLAVSAATSDVDATIAGTIDIGNNGMVFDYTAVDPAAAYAAVKAIVDSGRNGGNWLGKGITSTSSGMGGNRTIGLLNTADVAVSSFLGRSPDTTAILVRYVLPGDTNLSGSVDFDDLLALAQNYGGTDKRFDQGDVNYSGAVDFDDLLAVAQNYGGTVSLEGLSSDFAADWALAQSLVPEPTTLGLVAAGLTLLRRRR